MAIRPIAFRSPISLLVVAREKSSSKIALHVLVQSGPISPQVFLFGHETGLRARPYPTPYVTSLYATVGAPKDIVIIRLAGEEFPQFSA